jgi:hypothetical protein
MHMPSKTRQTNLEQKTYWEKRLSQRRSYLAEQGVEKDGISKDSAVKMMRARLREVGGRIAAIDALQKRTEELAAIKAERLAAPKKEKGKKSEAAEAPAVSKRQQKKSKKKESTPKAAEGGE